MNHQRLGALLGGPGVSGGLDAELGPHSVWRAAQVAGFAEPTGQGVALLSNPAPLAAAARRLGLSDIVVRCDWASFEPARGAFDETAFDAMARVIAALAAEDLSVRLILTGGETPAWAGPEAWLFPATPQYFARFAGEIASRFGEHLVGIVTLEAPAEWAMAGWVGAQAPPLRTGAVLDALAALDGLLAGHLLATDTIAEHAPQLERSLLGSPGYLGALETTVLAPDSDVLPSVLPDILTTQTPGRAARLFGPAAGATARWVVFGRGPNPVRGVLGSLGAFGAGAESVEVGDAVAALEAAGPGTVHVALRSVVASIGADAKRTIRRGAKRCDDIDAVVMAVERARAAGHHIGVVAVGELVDRWRFGTYAECEGLLGVDRFRSEAGFRIQVTDAAGVDVGAHLRAVLN